MGYRDSDVDVKNRRWFSSDIEAKSLLEIKMTKGTLRGLHPFKIEMEYPISVIAGKNGSGKSTLLAIACCAYHNNKNGYIPSDRNKNYYTFSDFFTQTADEVKVEGIEIWYKSLNHWRDTQTKKVYDGIGYQKRFKNKGGKWNTYQTRAKRNVIFSGIQRIVPPGERKTEKNCLNRYKSVTLEENTKNKILEIASRIMGKNYKTLDLRTVDRRRLFVVDRNNSHYSGFNMGAGENAVFTLLIELFSAGKNTLLVIDEIELGLHEEAQQRLMEELKKLCFEMHCQIICSTHSANIIDAVPPDARFYIEAFEDHTSIYKGISSAFALGHLSGGRKKEITIYTEDEVGKTIVLYMLPQNMRERVRIVPIGSDQAVLRQLCACYRDKNNACIAFLDGDKKSQMQQAKKQVWQMLEREKKDDVEAWLSTRLCYLPGDVWPEKYLLTVGEDYAVKELVTSWRIDENTLVEYIQDAKRAGKHREFYRLAEKTSLDMTVVRTDIVRSLAQKDLKEFTDISKHITTVLNDLV